MIAMAQPIESLPANDEKFIRTFAVIMSIDNGGPETEAARLPSPNAPPGRRNSRRTTATT